MSKTFYHKFLIIILLLIASGCDPDKYIGYDTEAQELYKITRIKGTITNFYTGYPVYHAKVKIGKFEASTDTTGQYQIDYLLTDDENRNKLVSILIEKENYYVFEDSVLIAHENSVMNFRLHYAAPILLDAARRNHPNNPLIMVYQLILKDYQGVDKIFSILIKQPYVDISGKLNINRIEMQQVHLLSTIEAYYQIELEEFYNMTPYYWIIVKDTDNFSDSLFHSVNLNIPDTWLFDPTKYK